MPRSPLYCSDATIYYRVSSLFPIREKSMCIHKDSSRTSRPIRRIQAVSDPAGVSTQHYGDGQYPTEAHWRVSSIRKAWIGRLPRPWRMLLRQYFALLAGYCRFVKQDLFEKSRAPLVWTTYVQTVGRSSCRRPAFGRHICEFGPGGFVIVCFLFLLYRAVSWSTARSHRATSSIE